MKFLKLSFLLLVSCSNQGAPSSEEVPKKLETISAPVNEPGPDITHFMDFHANTTRDEVIQYFSQKNIPVDLKPSIEQYTNGRRYMFQYGDCSNNMVVSEFTFLNIHAKNVIFQFDGE